MQMVTIGLNQGLRRHSYSMPGPVSTWMGDRLRMGKPEPGTQV